MLGKRLDGLKLREVAWTETAWRDLERIADYIAEDSPGYAAAVVRRVRDRARCWRQKRW